MLNGKASQLATIEEGEEEEMQDNEDVAAVASAAASISPMADNEGTDDVALASPAYANLVKSPVFMDEMKNDTDPSPGSSSQIGEHEQCPMIATNGNFQNLSKCTGLDTDTDTTKQGETMKKKKCSELEKINKQIRGILNKITPENFDKLSQEMHVL